MMTAYKLMKPLANMSLYEFTMKLVECQHYLTRNSVYSGLYSLFVMGTYTSVMLILTNVSLTT